MTAVRASPHKALCSDGVVSPQGCDRMGVPHRWVKRAWWNPGGSAVDAGRDAAART
jgi:hypothetical protein